MDAHPLWRDAIAAAGLVADGRAGLILRARAGPVREALLDWIAARAPLHRITAESKPEALMAGTDLLASLAAGRRIARPSMAERIGGAVLVVAGAERLPDALAGLIAREIDAGSLPRLLLLDEGADESAEAGVRPLIADRVAMRIDLAPLSIRDLGEVAADEEEGAVPADPLPLLCEAAAALGIGSVRAALQALGVARALAGGERPGDVALARAARLVLGPRARHLPLSPDAEPPLPAAEDAPSPEEMADREASGGEDRNRVLDAALAALPPGLLDGGDSQGRGRGGGSTAARSGTGARGRGGRLRPGLPRRGMRLDLGQTLIAAAPFQRLRGRAPGDRPALRRDDLRVRAPTPVQRAVTIFAVDASGSAAVARLAEVKGAVERLLAESYVRRDEVALIAFRGEGAQCLLPPTRSLARAKRELAALPGGGATPLAAGIVAGLEQALRSREAGRASLLLLLTDGGANIAGDGRRSRAAAQADALAAAARVAGAGVAAVVVDSSARGQATVRALAEAMAARYVALPRLDGGAIAAAVADARA